MRKFSLLLVFLTVWTSTLAARDVTILFTHDLHSMFRPHKTLDKNGNAVFIGGYARLATAIQQARAVAPQQTIVVDAGDFSSGSFFYTLFTTNCAELQLMGLMGYDVTTIGNHEFDDGAEGLKRALDAARQSGRRIPAIVAANVRMAGTKEYTVLERNGVRIGLFGLIGENAVEDAPKAAALTFENKITAAKRIVKILHEQEKVDLIVCLSHCGTEGEQGKSEDVQLAREVAGIDVIISGHSHTVLAEPIMVNNTVVASAGCYAHYLGELVIDADSKALRSYRLMAIDSTLAPDPSVAAAIDSFGRALNATYFHPLHKAIGDTVVFSNYYLSRTADSTGESLLGNLVADAFAFAAERALHIERPIAIVPAGTLRNDLYKGYSTEEDLFSILSLGVGDDGHAGYPLVCVYLNGAELANVCEVDASVTSMMPEAQLFFSGLRYSYDPHRLFFTKVTQVWIEDKEGNLQAPDKNTLYPVVAGLYSAQMLGVVGAKTHGLLSLSPKDADGNPVTDFTQQIIRLPKNAELKEWIALSNYLHSLSENGRLATLPEHYAEPEGQKIIKSQPNVLAMIATCFLFFGLLAIVVTLASRWRKKRTSNPRTGAPGNANNNLTVQKQSPL